VLLLHTLCGPTATWHCGDAEHEHDNDSGEHSSVVAGRTDRAHRTSSSYTMSASAERGTCAHCTVRVRLPGRHRDTTPMLVVGYVHGCHGSA
jgi:hypothetical protein